MVNRDKIRYINAVAAFDIETTSYYDNDEKKAIVYSYCVAIGDDVTIMRTREDFLRYMERIVEDYQVTLSRRFVIYVHNLAYEWQFIKHYFEWEDAFCNGNEHNVIRATTADGIEFRCSYALTNTSLAQVGKQVGIAKLKGDLDYSKRRHAETPLTEAELAYIRHDVEIIIALIRQKLQDDDYTTIPMTKTGYVRKAIRRAHSASPDYQAITAALTMTSETYMLARKAYQGGYTHASARGAGKVLTDVVAYDLASSYPATITSQLFPMSEFEEADPEDAEELLEYHAAILDVEFVNANCAYDFPMISESRCVETRHPIVDNGRVYSAESVRVIVTDVDFDMLKRNYDYDEIVIHSIHIAEYDYLPKPLVMEVLGFYAKKTTLKGVPGMEKEYGLAKENVNCAYGMMGTDPVREEFLFVDGVFHLQPMNIEESLDKVNTSRKRFLYYPWGAWTTAHSRATLLTAIMDLEDAGVQVAYCDTDSIYAVDHPAITGIISASNDAIRQRLDLAMAMQGLEPDEADELISPKDINGERHTLGLWDCETPEPLQEFKTLGAKRYAKRKADGTFSITVSGLSTAAAGYVEEHGAMDFFSDGMTIPADRSGRSIHAYSESTAKNILDDYLGNLCEVEQTGFIHLEESEYHMGVSDEYLAFVSWQQR